MSKVYYHELGLVEPEDLLSGKIILPPGPIAFALASKGRFSGQTAREGYDVLRHSLYVSDCARRIAHYQLGIGDDSRPEVKRWAYEAELWGLLHDATEAILSDVAAPIKRTEAMAPYRDLERNLSASYQIHYIPTLWTGKPGVAAARDMVDRIVHVADIVALNMEAMHLMHPDAVENIMETTLDADMSEYLLREVAFLFGRGGNHVSWYPSTGAAVRFSQKVLSLQIEIERQVKDGATK